MRLRDDVANPVLVSGARNEYLLAIQTANAHQSQYYHTWLHKCLIGQCRILTNCCKRSVGSNRFSQSPRRPFGWPLFQALLFLRLTCAGAGTECGVHGAVADYISILSATELATCNAQHVSLNGGLSRQHHVSRVTCNESRVTRRYQGGVRGGAETRQPRHGGADGAVHLRASRGGQG